MRHAWLDEVEAQVDFWVNLGTGVILFFVQSIALAVIFGAGFNIWIVVRMLVGAFIAQYRATRSARDWGEFVKAAFDPYRFNLLKSTGITAPKSLDEEKALWTKNSQAITYRIPNSLPELQKTTPTSKQNKAKLQRSNFYAG